MNLLQKLRDWFFADISNRMTNLEQRVIGLENEMRAQLTRLDNETQEIKKMKPPKRQIGWQAMSAIASIATALIALWMLFTVHQTSKEAAEHEIRAKEIEHEARARIDLRREGTNDVFEVMNYGKIPIEKAGLFIRYYEIQGTNGNIVTNYFSDFGRFHPNDPQPVRILDSPMKTGIEPPLGFALALLRGDQIFMKTNSFETEVFVWLFYKRREWVKESETLGNITDLQQRNVLLNSIQQFRSSNKNRGLKSQ